MDTRLINSALPKGIGRKPLPLTRERAKTMVLTLRDAGQSITLNGRPATIRGTEAGSFAEVYDLVRKA